MKKCSCEWCDRNEKNWNGKFYKVDNILYCDKHYQQIKKKGQLISDETIVYNIGINDMGRGWTKRGDKNKRTYDLWVHILARCYDSKELEKHSSYKNCFVCNRWLRLSNFNEDLSKIKNYDLWINSKRGEYHLDKDILNKGNKCYCLESCIFVDKNTNSMERHYSGRKRKDNNSGVIGVRYIDKTSTYECGIKCFGKSKSKRFKSFEEAVVQRLLWEMMYYGEKSPQKHLFGEYLFGS